MPKPPERGNLEFDPPLKPGTERFVRAWDIMMEMGLRRAVVFHYVGQGWIKGLSFPSKAEAMIFKLRL